MTPRLSFLIFPLLGALSFSGCGTVDTLQSATAEQAGEVGDGLDRAGAVVGNGFQRLAAAATSPFRPGIPVVEVREQDLKDLPTGHEKALAYQAEQRRRQSAFWDLPSSSELPEPDLPEESDELNVEASLLPPIE